MAYPMVFRIAVANAYDECLSSAEVAATFNCSEAWVRRLIQRRRETDSLAPRPPRRPDTRRLDDADLARLRDLVAAQPDLNNAVGGHENFSGLSRATSRYNSSAAATAAPIKCSQFTWNLQARRRAAPTPTTRRRSRQRC